MNDLEKFGTQLEIFIKQGIDAGSDLFRVLVDWCKRHSFGLTLAFGTALSQYIGSRGKNWVPLAIVGTLILQVSKEIAEEKGLKT